MGKTLPRLQKAVLGRAVRVVAKRRTVADVAVSMAALTLQEASAPQAWRSGKPSAFRPVKSAKSYSSKNENGGFDTREKETH